TTMRTTGATRSHYTMTRELPGTSSRRHSRTPVVERRTHLRIPLGHVHVVTLHGRRLEVMVALGQHLIVRRARAQATGATVEGHVVAEVVVDHGAVIDVCHVY